MSNAGELTSATILVEAIASMAWITMTVMVSSRAVPSSDAMSNNGIRLDIALSIAIRTVIR